MEIKNGIIITLVLMYLQLLINYFRWKMTAKKQSKTIRELMGKFIRIRNNDNFPGLKVNEAIKGALNAGEALKPKISKGRSLKEDESFISAEKPKAKWNSFQGYEPEWKAAGFESEDEWMLYIKENA